METISELINDIKQIALSEDGKLIINYFGSRDFYNVKYNCKEHNFKRQRNNASLREALFELREAIQTED